MNLMELFFMEILLLNIVILKNGLVSLRGHCGMIDHHEILNDETLPLLCKVAVSQAQAGAHMAVSYTHLTDP